MNAGRNADAIRRIQDWDSDGDGDSNVIEVGAGCYPGQASDTPDLVGAQSLVLTGEAIRALPRHEQFLLMNSTKSDDHYAQYTGVSLEVLLQSAGMLDSATSITVFSPDGWSETYPLTDVENPMVYPVVGTYPESLFYHREGSEAWCDYRASSVAGHVDGEPIVVEGGLRMMLAYERNGEPLHPGVLNDHNKLDGEGPYRLIVPQKRPSPPDLGKKKKDQNVIWPYDPGADHNSGSSARTVSMIRVNPLPEGTTDVDVLERGWSLVEREDILIYGAIQTRDQAEEQIVERP